jgi:hypothetical protein
MGFGRKRIDWKHHVAGQARSGLSVPDYCRKAGFSTWSFYTNRKRLREDSVLLPAVAAQGSTPSEAPEGLPFFNIGTFSGGPQLTIRFADATVLEISYRPSPQHLAALIASLKTPVPAGRG